MTDAAIKAALLKLLGKIAPEVNLEELSPDAT